MKKLYLLIILFILICCKTHKVINQDQPALVSKSPTKQWYFNDFSTDNIPGISYNEWLKNNHNKIKCKDIIVATIDCQIDIYHEDLQGQLWTNLKEIPNNRIDDDKNGYIDDVNGWNFLGTKSGNYIVWENYEYVRCVREWKPHFQEKKQSEIEHKDLNRYEEYQRALKMLESERAVHENWLNSLVYAETFFPKSKDTLKHFFPKEDYSYEQLDSLYKIYKINDKIFRQRRLDKDQDLGALIDFMRVRFELGEKTLDKVIDMKIQVDSIYNKSLNIDYDERIFIDDNPSKLEKGYGTNNICAKIKGIREYQGHNTKVSSIIAAKRDNKKGIDGFSNNIKIMPLTASASGDEHDKDISLAIRYAVDNGAKVINMSFSKDFSLNKEWVFDAIKYAEKNNVLIVHCAGIDGFDIDVNPKYPNDSDHQNPKEISNNFICVGSITNKVGASLVSDFSNYGKQNVDLFAPGSDIYTAIPENQYETGSGTSFSAPMVSGTAALIWSYYPNLSVQEVKQIILNSGSEYDIEVLVPNGEGKKVPFKELSKSGRVLNVYNAMKMAKEMSKKKK
jgi:subtilisin family serine protease